MNEVRLGIVGCGGMGTAHMIEMAKLARAKLVAASDASPQHLAAAVDRFGVEGFADATQMYGSGKIDAVVIATPHPAHPPLAISAFEHGLHVLSEKPLAVTVSAAKQVISTAARHRDLKFAVMFQLRSYPKWRRIKQIIDEGRFGALQRVTWIATSWFRTQAYFKSAGWRATWAGEGGGLLMNQLPHNLDVLCWLTGMPERVTAHVGFGKHHDIEVDDETAAFLNYPNGAIGVVVASTGEAPGNDYLELVGDRGQILVNNRTDNTFEFNETKCSVDEFRRTHTVGSALPPMDRQQIETEPGIGPAAIHRNFVDAILDGTPLLAPGTEAIHSLELANALIMSGLRNRPVDLPLDTAAYDALLKEMIDRSETRIQSRV